MIEITESLCSQEIIQVELYSLAINDTVISFIHCEICTMYFAAIGYRTERLMAFHEMFYMTLTPSLE